MASRAVGQLRQAEPQVVAQASKEIVSRMEEVRLKLKEALVVGILEALRRIFSFSALFVGLSLLALLALPDKELSGGFGPQPSLE